MKQENSVAAHFDSKISRVSPQLSVYSEEGHLLPSSPPKMSKFPKSQMPTNHRTSDLQQVVQVLNYKQVQSK